MKPFGDLSWTPIRSRTGKYSKVPVAAPVIICSRRPSELPIGQAELAHAKHGWKTNSLLPIMRPH